MRDTSNPDILSVCTSFILLWRVSFKCEKTTLNYSCGRSFFVKVFEKRGRRTGIRLGQGWARYWYKITTASSKEWYSSEILSLLIFLIVIKVIVDKIFVRRENKAKKWWMINHFYSSCPALHNWLCTWPN